MVEILSAWFGFFFFFLLCTLLNFFVFANFKIFKQFTVNCRDCDSESLNHKDFLSKICKFESTHCKKYRPLLQ